MAKAKAKAAPKKETTDSVDETITREEVKETQVEKAPPTPKASNVEKTESFTAAFKNDAHAAADHFLQHSNESHPEEISREESDAGDEGVRVTITYK